MEGDSGTVYREFHLAVPPVLRGRCEQPVPGRRNGDHARQPRRDAVEEEIDLGPANKVIDKYIDMSGNLMPVFQGIQEEKDIREPGAGGE